MNHSRITPLLPILYILFWLAVNLLFLTSFPFVHTDELWLSGLSRTMIENGTLCATEDFFDLYPRAPHALKILYHILQILFIRIFGYSLATVRLLSLLTGGASLAIFYQLARRVLPEGSPDGTALAATIAFSLDVQFIYTAHHARQEIFLVLLMLSILLILLSEKPPLLRGALAGILTGLALGFHPNAFLIAWPAGLFLLGQILTRRRRPREGAAFLLAAAAAASLFAALSFAFNPHFLQDYAAYGEPLGVLDAPDLKLLRLPRFYTKLFNQISGTYYTPPIQTSLMALPLLLAAALFRRRGRLAFCGIAGLNTALVLLGKYSQPSVVFLFPFLYLLWTEMADLRPVRIAGLLFATTLLFFSVSEIRTPRESYADYTQQLNELIPPGSAALGSIYSEGAMVDGTWYEWRNLPYLQEAGVTLEEYLSERGITYIVYPEELDFIYENRPYWNTLYGNPAHWYPQLQEILETRGTVLSERESPVYAMRLTAYREQRPWKVQIYRLSTSE